MTVAAGLSLFGLDGLRFLKTTDDTEREVLLAVHNRALELAQHRDENLAVLIVNAYVRARKRG